MEYKIDRHTVEIRYSPTGSCDPWTLDYARELGVGLMCTSDIANFALIDGDTLYKLKGVGTITFEHYIDNRVFDEPGMFDIWLDEISDRKFGSLAESKAQIDKMKKHKDEFDAMTPEEKEEQRRKWREAAKKRRELLANSSK